jgi:hypothetical protein
MDAISPLREIWGDLTSGIGGRTVYASFTIADVQQINVNDGSVWISPGKQVLIDKIIDLMREGQIDTQNP